MIVKSMTLKEISPDEYNHLLSIGDFAFNRCYSLTRITIPNSVTHLGANPFRGCLHLESICLSPDHSALGMIDDMLFSKVDGRLICLPRTSKQSQCILPRGITSIGDSAFYNCTSVVSVALSEGVTNIDDDAFYNCPSLTNISLPNGLTRIGRAAFLNCTSLSASGKRNRHRSLCILRM